MDIGEPTRTLRVPRPPDLPFEEREEWVVIDGDCVYGTFPDEGLAQEFAADIEPEPGHEQDAAHVRKVIDP